MSLATLLDIISHICLILTLYLVIFQIFVNFSAYKGRDLDPVIYYITYLDAIVFGCLSMLVVGITLFYALAELFILPSPDQNLDIERGGKVAGEVYVDVDGEEEVADEIDEKSPLLGPGAQVH